MTSSPDRSAPFRFNTTDTWQIAFHHGHSAFRLLRIAQDIEDEYRTGRARLKDLSYGQSEYLEVIGRAKFLTDDMFKISAASIMMFQAMMEALINHTLAESQPLRDAVKGAVEEKHNKMGRRPSFQEKWEGALAHLGKETSSFSAYHGHIYVKYRNKLVHPSDVKNDAFDDLSVPGLLAGYADGWEAYRLLFDGMERPHFDDSWGTMCRTYSLRTESP